MPRYLGFAILLLFAFVAIGSFAQVTITNSGYATQSGPAVPPIPASPPILFAPTVHLGEAPTRAIQVSGYSGVAGDYGPPPEVVIMPSPEAQAAAASAAPTQPQQMGFNFGAAQFETAGGLGGVGQNINGKSLAEVAREQRQRSTNTNVQVYTNSNIEQMNQTGGTINNPSATTNPNPDNWAPNNGVISPEPPPQSSVGGEQQPNQPSNIPPTGIRTPYVPKPQSYSPGQHATPDQPQPRSQLELRPLVQRDHSEIAMNDPRAVPLAKREQEQNSANQAQTSSDQDQSQADQLPRSASRLPLLGVAGLFSVTMGIFVRYQRARSR